MFARTKIKELSTMPKFATRPKVMEYLVKNAGLPVFAVDIARETGLTPQQVRTAVNNIKVSDVDGAVSQERLETIVAGNQWRWHEKPVGSCGPMFEQVAALNDGSVLQQDEDGKLWHATEVNLP